MNYNNENLETDEAIIGWKMNATSIRSLTCNAGVMIFSSPTAITKINGISKYWTLAMSADNPNQSDDLTLALYFDPDSSINYFTELAIASEESMKQYFTALALYKFYITNKQNNLTIIWYATMPHMFIAQSKQNHIGQRFKKDEILKYVDSDDDTVSVYCEVIELGTMVKINQLPNSTPKIDNERRMFCSTTQPDTILTVDGNEFAVHQSLLVSQSPVFAVMFCCGTSDKIPITDVSPRVMRKMLEFIYTNEISDFEDLAGDLLGAAQTYLLEGLKNIAVQAVKRNITIENVTEILSLAERYESKELFIHAMYFIHLNKALVIIRPEFQALEQSRLHNCARWLC